MSAKKQTRVKRACIDCHFLTLLQIGGEHYEYPDLDVIPSVVSRNQVPLSSREQIKKKEDLTFESPFDGNDYLLGCYEECWSELQPEAYKKRYETVVETSRNDGVFFFEYSPTMSFKAGDEIREKGGKRIEKRKGNEKKLRGKKKYYIVPEKRDNIIKEMIEGYPRGSNVFIARKVMLEIVKVCGTTPDGKPLYKENTLAKEVSKFKTKKKGRKNTR
jgi:hypothetical protein